MRFCTPLNEATLLLDIVRPSVHSKNVASYVPDSCMHRGGSALDGTNLLHRDGGRLPTGVNVKIKCTSSGEGLFGLADDNELGHSPRTKWRSELGRVNKRNKMAAEAQVMLFLK